MNEYKKLAIMQPYFLPYLGYYSLIKSTDEFVINDEVQMINKGWIERNRILKQQGGWHYIRVPLVRHSHTAKIETIQIRNNENWKEKILAQLQHYKRKAPYYRQVLDLLRGVFSNDFKTITALNINLLKTTCDYIGIDFNYNILSELKLNLSNVSNADEGALDVCKKLGYNHYINPILGKQFYDVKKYLDNGVKINFLRIRSQKYDQGSKKFTDSLSIIDVLMFNSPSEIVKRLENYTLE